VLVFLLLSARRKKRWPPSRTFEKKAKNKKQKTKNKETKKQKNKKTKKQKKQKNNHF
jgi:hypothetical protein